MRQTRQAVCAINQSIFLDVYGPNLELKTRPRQLLGDLPVDMLLPGVYQNYWLKPSFH
jgi:hypothetical protein